ncbi:MAG: trehalose-phosphatase [Caulobacteraceae bacterium]
MTSLAVNARRLTAPPLLAREAALFADLDGTLAPIEARPDQVRPEAARTALLRDLSAALDGRLAILSGRGLDDLDRLLGGSVTAVAAIHGLIRRDARGWVHEAPPHPDLPRAAEALVRFAAAHPGLLAETKSHAAALHYRAAPRLEAEARAFAASLAERYGLVPQPGRMVIELRTPGPDKGEALAAFMAEPPFAGATPVFIGDDATDEHGFGAAERLGGYGVIVGDRRPTRARFALAGVADALEWLGACREGR